MNIKTHLLSTVRWSEGSASILDRLELEMKLRRSGEFRGADVNAMPDAIAQFNMTTPSSVNLLPLSRCHHGECSLARP